MQTSLEGLTLHVEDLDRSVDFYRRIPGARLVNRRGGEFALFVIGNSRLGLLACRLLPKGSPGFHIEISTSSAGIEDLHRGVTAAGIETDGKPQARGWGETTFHATDPDGNQIEFDTRAEG